MKQTPVQIREDVDLHHLNTFHVSARARYLATVTETSQLHGLLEWQRARQIPFMLIGQGSNLLFKADYPGLLIELHTRGTSMVQQTDTFVDVQVQAGEVWHDFVQYSLAQRWYGLENLSLIPGTVGAAPVQNIGAYGVEVKDTLLHLEALELSSGRVRQFTNTECGFSYRQSYFKQQGKDKFIITSVTFRLSREPTLNLNYPALQTALAHVPSTELTPELISETVCAIRRSKLPDPGVIGNAGSFFWNPHVDKPVFEALKTQHPALPGYADHDGIKIPAAWLIEHAGWKGYREGDVGVHRDHALVLVNYGAATGAELVALSEKIQASVLEKFGIQLWPEVRIV